MTRLAALLALLAAGLVCCAAPPAPGDDTGPTSDPDAGPGCTPRSADPGEFDRSCADPSDCAKVYVPGCACDCAAVALAAHETQRYLDANRPCCTNLDGTCGACFDDTQAVCRDGTCELD